MDNDSVTTQRELVKFQAEIIDSIFIFIALSVVVQVEFNQDTSLTEVPHIFVQTFTPLGNSAVSLTTCL